MRIGDPAADLATLLGPTANDPRPLILLEQVQGVFTAEERERLPHLGRATLLDGVIDPLSDWIDAGTVPAHQQAVRTGKERIHKRALACYGEMYRRSSGDLSGPQRARPAADASVSDGAS